MTISNGQSGLGVRTQMNLAITAAQQTVAPASAVDVLAVRNGTAGALSMTYDSNGNVTSTTEVFDDVVLTSTYIYTNNNLTRVDTTDGTTTWRQTLAYANGQVSSVTSWVQQ